MFSNFRGIRITNEIAFRFKDMPDKVRSRIHYMAWESGHLAGYVDVTQKYHDLVELANIIYETSEEAK